MNEPLQRWCSTSLDWLHDRLVPPNGGIDGSSARETSERAIEAAAFLACASANGIKSNLPNLACHPVVIELIPQLTAGCSCESIERPETLGSIHEYLVASREMWGTKRAARSAKSRKRAGIFYTPKPVIEYMVEQTVSRRLSSSTTDQPVYPTILDPAAGCGAFLVAAYRCLLNRHLDWSVNYQSSGVSNDVVAMSQGKRLTFACCEEILFGSIHGVDLDAAAIETTRRVLWLTMMTMSAGNYTDEQSLAAWDRLSTNLKSGNSLLGADFQSTDTPVTSSLDDTRFDWHREYPAIADQGGFDLIIGNPPYRRELDFKRELDQIAASDLGKFRSPRMDLWYYFVHRGIALLKMRGSLSFITSAYWLQGSGADKLIATIQNDVHLDELFLLRDQPVFHGVSGQHVIFRLTKRTSDSPTTIKIVQRESETIGQSLGSVMSAARFYEKEAAELFQTNRLNVWPSAKRFLEKMNRHTGLASLGMIRQGIAENPATINRRTMERFRQDAIESNWKTGEGVFSLTAAEVQSLQLNNHEAALLRPYHDLCDLRRYWTAEVPSRNLIYATRRTCPEIESFPQLLKHLNRFRRVMESRRETRIAHNQWWHLHWPREERIWTSNKLVVQQMAKRPSFVPAFSPMYVSFSANVFIPATETREDLRYLSGLLNSQILWAWFEHHAKHRGIGLELNGHILQQAPVRRIDFANPRDVKLHDQLVQLVDERIAAERRLAAKATSAICPSPFEIDDMESQIEAVVAELYELDTDERHLAGEIIGRTRD